MDLANVWVDSLIDIFHLLHGSCWNNWDVELEGKCYTCRLATPFRLSNVDVYNWFKAKTTSSSVRYIFTRRQRNLSYKPETHQLYRLKRANSPRKVLLAITIQDSGQTWEWIILSARVIHIHKRMQISPFSGIWCGAQSAPSVVYAKLPRHVIRKRRIAISTLYLYQQ